MYPQYYANSTSQGEQPQGNPIKRTEQGFRQDLQRQSQLQNAYPPVGISPALQSPQFDPQFFRTANPTIPFGW